MPAVRDAVFAQEAVTTDGGLTIPMCDYASGDLLFAFFICDAAVTPTSVTNGVGSWTLLFTRNNTVGLTCYWKYAAASGEGDVVLAATPSDTYCGYLVSVRDVFQGYTSGSPPVKNDVAQASASRFNMPTLSAQANSLILMTFANSSSQPSVVFGEGRGITQTMINGAAEGGSLGWFVQASTATTPSDIPCAVTVVGAGAAAVVECRAPVGGATVLPAYCAADDSQLMLLNPIVAYDSSTALAATADTNFGTSIGGVTANDATVATVNDSGQDPKGFMGAAGLTNAASTTDISGAEAVVPAGKYNIGNSNILGHLRSITTVAAQNVGAIGTTRGVWFGMKSGATTGTDYKIWQVHGGDAPYYGVAVIPFVVNPENTDTRATAGTLSTSDVRRYGWWMSGSGALTGQMLLGSVWKMGTTTIAGGTSTEPIGIEGLEFALSKGKTRWSAVRQGANQLLCLQAVQFGNGGTNPVYLDLDSTAIEFPSKRNLTKKLINYNGPDDAIGLTYYAGASDTIKHRASVISSPSKYHWRIHASSSASATYDFSGLSVIGAGDVQLRAVTTFTRMSFTSCPTITQNSAVISGCTFNNSKVISATLGDMDNISDCSFTSPGTGHAIEVSGTAGDITLSGNIFTGYSGTSTNAAIYVNIASGTVNITIGGGGNTPSIRTAGATVNVISGATVTFTGLPTGTDIVILTAGTDTILQQVDQHGSTSYAWGYSGTPTVDVGFIKPGYVPFYIRGLALGSTDSSIPVSLSADRNYQP